MNPKTKVTVKENGINGSTLKLIEKVSRALDRGGYGDLAKEYRDKVVMMQSYDAALELSCQYVWIGGQ